MNHRAAEEVLPRRKVLHVITGLEDGGAEAVLFRLCSHDRNVDHRVVSLGSAGKYGPLLREIGVPVLWLNMPRGRVTLRGLNALWRHFRRVRPEVVQTWLYHADLVGGVIACLATVKNINWGIHNTILVQGQSSRTAILAAALCARLSRVVPRRIICCAEGARQVHIELGYDPSRILVVPNGYDLAEFQPDEAAGTAIRHELAIDTHASVIGFVARYDTQKDHPNLLHALALLRKRGVAPICLLIGTGMTDGNVALVDQISALGLADQIRLLGRRNDVPGLFNALDIHVMSSSAEAFPNVLAESMACGTPCVTTDVGDAAMIVGDTGWVVPPRNPQALADAIADALAQRTTAAWAGRQAAARARIVDNFSIDKMVERYHAAWSS